MFDVLRCKMVCSFLYSDGRMWWSCALPKQSACCLQCFFVENFFLFVELAFSSRILIAPKRQDNKVYVGSNKGMLLPLIMQPWGRC